MGALKCGCHGDLHGVSVFHHAAENRAECCESDALQRTQ